LDDWGIADVIICCFDNLMIGGRSGYLAFFTLGAFFAVGEKDSISLSICLRESFSLFCSACRMDALILITRGEKALTSKKPIVCGWAFTLLEVYNMMAVALNTANKKMGFIFVCIA
jgi:hypothetical protein